nr:TMV resistance protein N-like isoform X1 [Malus domestica]
MSTQLCYRCFPTVSDSKPHLLDFCSPRLPPRLSSLHQAPRFRASPFLFESSLVHSATQKQPLPFVFGRELNYCSAIMVDTTMTAHGASSSSSSSKLWKYDVFLSFRGEDTRKGFTAHLHAALKEKDYEAFIDNDNLKRGEEIKEELFRAIEESRISIIVFSKSYADSSWCLDELVKIMECRSQLGRHVLPIFYHVEASDIRKQEGSLAPIFEKYEEDIREEKDDIKREHKKKKVKQWREALTQAANLSGQDLKNIDNGHEAKLIRRIIYENIWELLPNTTELHVAKHPVGINSRIQDIINDLSSGRSDDVLMVGIWGMGGLGKTTAAKAIYNQIHRNFQSKCFLVDVRDIASQHGLVYLQEKFLFDILQPPKSQNFSSVDAGVSVIKQHLQHRRVLVIIDNVDKFDQLDAIVGTRDRFGPGSRIIITTRNEHLLKQVKVDKVHEAHKMNDEEALELFSWHAFENSCPDEGYYELSKNVISYCGGLPLALQVLGSLLVDRALEEWKSQLKKLEKIPEGEILKKLRISFVGLDVIQKAIFLDICCFFIGMDKNYVTKILDGCGFSAKIGISVLCERCLVTVDEDKLRMHDLLRDMGRVIISEESPSSPEKWSRLWHPEEVTDVLTDMSGTGEIQGLILDCFSSNNASFSTEAFANMKKLRLLQLNYVGLTGDYKHLPKKLIWLCWRGFPLHSIPDNFLNQPQLVVLDMQGSKLVQVWEGSKSLQKLKIIILSHSLHLKKSPDFSQLPDLEELILEGCEWLSEIHPSIGHLKRLSLVNLKGCCMLISLPGDFYKSKSVETLCLNGCSKFTELHENLGEMISLRILEADLTGIRQVPPSTVRLKKLTRLSVRLGSKSLNHLSQRSRLKNLARLSRMNMQVQPLGLPLHLPHSLHGLHSLRELDLSFCELADNEMPEDLGSLNSLQKLDLQGNKFHTLPDLSGLSKLETLRLSGCRYLHRMLGLPTNLKFLYAFHCSALETMPNFSKMSNMRELHLSDSPKLTEVPGLDKSLNSMTWIDMQSCTNLTADFRKNILQGWTSCGFGGIFLHGNYLPNWFMFVNNGNKVSFDIRQSDNDHNFEGITLFCYNRSGNRVHPPLPLAITVINNTKRTKLRVCMGNKDWEELIYDDNYLWQGQLSNNKLNLQVGDKVEVDIIFPEFDFSTILQKTGVNLVWDKHMKENMHDLDKAGYTFETNASSESSESEPEERPQAQLSIPGLQATPTKKKTRAQASKASQSSRSSVAHAPEAGPQATKKPTVVSREEPLGAKLYKKDKPVIDATLKELEDIRGEGSIKPEASSPSARPKHVSPSRAKPSKAKVGELASQVGQGSSSIPSTSPSLVVAPTSQFDPSSGEMLHFVEDNSNSSFPGHESQQLAATAFGEPIVPDIPVVSEVTSPQAAGAVSTDTVVASKVPISQPQASVEGSGNTPQLASVNDPSQHPSVTTHPPSSKASGISIFLFSPSCCML